MSSLASVARCAADDILVAWVTAAWTLVCSALTIYDLRLLGIVLLQTVASSTRF